MTDRQWLWMTGETPEEMIEYGPTVEVFFAQCDCSGCGQAIWVFHSSADEHGREVTSTLYWFPEVLRQIDHAREAFGIPQMGAIKRRCPDAGGEIEMSQGCVYCDGIVRGWDLHEDFCSIVSTMVPAYTLSLAWPPAELQATRAYRQRLADAKNI